MRHKWLSLLICLCAIPILELNLEASVSNSTPLSFQTFGTIKVASPHARGYLFNNKSATFYPPVTIETVNSRDPNQFVIHSGEVKITSVNKSGNSTYIASFTGPITYRIVQKHASMVRTITGSAAKAKYEQAEGLLAMSGNLEAKVQDKSAFSSPAIIHATSLLIHIGSDRFVEIKGDSSSDFMQFHPVLSYSKSRNLKDAAVTIKHFTKALFNKSEAVHITGASESVDIENGPLSMSGITTTNSILADFSPQNFSLDMNSGIVTSLDWKPSLTTETSLNGHCSSLNYSEKAKLMHLSGNIHVLDTEMNDKKALVRKISIQAEEMQIPTAGTSDLSVKGTAATDHAELVVFSGAGNLPVTDQLTERFNLANFDQLFSDSNNEYKIVGANSSLSYSVDPVGTTAQVTSSLITAKMPVEGSPTEIHASGGVQFHYYTPQTRAPKTGELIKTVLGVNGNTKSFDLLLASGKNPVTDSVLTLNGPSILAIKLTGQKTPITYTDKINDKVVLNLTKSIIDWFTNNHSASVSITPNPSSTVTPALKSF